MYYIAICDDSLADLSTITGHLSKLKKTCQLEYITFSSGEELFQSYHDGRRYDLIILDMCMEGMNGIETATLIRKLDETVPILIVTATVQFAVEGYKINASRYIVKPVKRDEFNAIVQDTLEKTSRRRGHYFTFSAESGTTKVKTEDIYYFESDIRTIYIVTKDARLCFTGKISKIEEQMQDCGFFRVHKSYIVNLQHVYNIYKDFVTMDNNEKIPISKYRRKEANQKLLEFMGN